MPVACRASAKAAGKFQLIVKNENAQRAIAKDSKVSTQRVPSA